MPNPCSDVEQATCECPPAELTDNPSGTECGGITLAHETVVLPHDVVAHTNRFLAVKYRYRTA